MTPALLSLHVIYQLPPGVRVRVCVFVPPTLTEGSRTHTGPDNCHEDHCRVTHSGVCYGLLFMIIRMYIQRRDVGRSAIYTACKA